jgi:hypothetical protein
MELQGPPRSLAQLRLKCDGLATGVESGSFPGRHHPTVPLHTPLHACVAQEAMVLRYLQSKGCADGRSAALSQPARVAHICCRTATAAAPSDPATARALGAPRVSPYPGGGRPNCPRVPLASCSTPAQLPRPLAMPSSPALRRTPPSPSPCHKSAHQRAQHPAPLERVQRPQPDTPGAGVVRRRRPAGRARGAPARVPRARRRRAGGPADAASAGRMFCAGFACARRPAGLAHCTITSRACGSKSPPRQRRGLVTNSCPPMCARGRARVSRSPPRCCAPWTRCTGPGWLTVTSSWRTSSWTAAVAPAWEVSAAPRKPKCASVRADLPPRARAAGRALVCGPQCAWQPGAGLV